MSNNLSWKEAITKVLNTTESSLHYVEIAEEIVSKGYRSKVGANPASNVNSTINLSIKNDEKTPFRKAGDGYYLLNKNENNAKSEPIKSEETTVVINSFGIFWEREKIFWETNPSLFGKQQIGADKVDFKDQIGVYILYDHRTSVYVGRSTKSTIGCRLNEHTEIRLNNRWNRFSWFGLLKVNESGELKKEEISSKPEDWIVTLESLLIEVLEPPLNRKRGDKMSSMEYYQVTDPKIERRQQKALLNNMAKTLD